MIITIDGPAGSGKTTVAKGVAERLGFLYFDTGAIYRALTYLVLKDKIDLNQKDSREALLKGFRYEIKREKGINHYFVNEEDVTEKIRTAQVTSHVSAISSFEEVRKIILNLARNWGKMGNAIFEGRDMGTVVFPEADLKIFLSARAAVRTERRYKEMKEEGITSEQVFEQITTRDQMDSTREHAPLKRAEDAIEIDTSDLSIDQVIEKIADFARQKRKRA